MNKWIKQHRLQQKSNKEAVHVFQVRNGEEQLIGVYENHSGCSFGVVHLNEEGQFMGWKNTRIEDYECIYKNKKWSPTIEQVIGDFDFDRVLRVMQALEWKWGRYDKDLKTPDIDEMKEVAKELLTIVAFSHGNEILVGTGGFWARKKDEYLELFFSIENSRKRAIDPGWKITEEEWQEFHHREAQ